MTQTNTPAHDVPSIHWNGHAVPLDFPYLPVLLLGRPRHGADEFSLRHPPMEQGRRAKIFAPFDALDGYDESLESKNALYTDKIILDESEKEALNRRLTALRALTANSRLAKKNRAVVTVTYFVLCQDVHSFACGLRGQYRTETGMVEKVDMEISHTLTVHHQAIPFDDILSITAEDESLFCYHSADAEW